MTTTTFGERMARLRRMLCDEGPTPTTLRRFRRLILDYYERHGRPFTWREEPTPYRVVVSEIMLQQTQTSRVDEAFPAFVAAFPDFAALAAAPLGDVVRRWQGLGYNRRALALKRLAERVVHDYAGQLPTSLDDLRNLPFIHLFFPDGTTVDDETLLLLVRKSLPRTSPRRWYNALMDFGVFIKHTVGNAGRRSSHYQRQSPFEGSDRQIRGLVLRHLARGGPMTARGLVATLARDERRVRRLLAVLVDEGLIERRGHRYGLVT